VTDDARAPLDAARLRAGLQPPWTHLEVVEEAESTNRDVLGAAPGSVLAAEYQHSGRGRLDRSWTSPRSSGLLFSAVVRPGVPPASWGWLPLLSGVAVCDAVAATTGLAPVLKWPNDVLIDDLKVAGMLVQTAGADAIIGIGLNVSTTRAELPVETATSLALAGVAVDRSELLAAVLAELGRRYTQWTDAGGDAVAAGLAADYRQRCATIGRPVTVTDASGEWPATALAVDGDGRLRVRWDDSAGAAAGEQALAAGDIVHLRARAAAPR
jgi:BirA family transcriptional regulator, biotin operon repressor / biotin---[acetyl-CoA-carboxylase] ligase